MIDLANHCYCTKHKLKMTLLRWWGTLPLIAFLLFFCAINILAETNTCQEEANEEAGEQTCKSNLGNKDAAEAPIPHIFPGCRLYLAPSTVQNGQQQDRENACPRLGLFTSAPLRRGQRIAPSDIIIHLTDYLPQDLAPFLSSHSYNPQQFGGHYEAKSVASILPGVASTAVSTFHKDANAMPFRRDYDEANVPRTTMAGSGAFSHYHNVTFYAKHDLDAGSEIFIGLGETDVETYKWYEDRIQFISDRQRRNDDIHDNHKVNHHRVDVSWLEDNGVCLDNLIAKKSKVNGAGRGAFATRFIPMGAIVTASPLVPILRNSTMTKRVKHLGKIRSSVSQLIINYCFGHVNSSILLYPTSPVVNLINHAANSGDDSDEMNRSSKQKNKSKHKPNVRLRWSKETKERLTSKPRPDSNSNIHSNQFVIQFIATRDINPNEEILLDYGDEWQSAWDAHVAQWSPPPNPERYTPSYVMDDVAGLLRNEKEQATHPYPPNVMTACFYKYSAHETNHGIARSTATAGGTTVVKWKMDRQTFDYANLRPCSIMQRDDAKGDGFITYTALMKNYAGMKKEEMIPKGQVHVVDSIPRNAVTFVDKMYSTDVHLKNVFRHEIQIPDALFPSSWID